MRLGSTLALALPLVLAGCFEDQPTLDTSGRDAYEASVAAMQAELAAPKAEALGKALFALSFSGDPGSEAANIVPAAYSARDPGTMLSKLRPQVDGATADEIIEAARTYRLASVERELERLRREVDKWAGYSVAARTLIKTINIRTPRYYWDETHIVERPIIDFTIVNDSPIALKRIVLLGTLKSPGREIPWVSSTFSYTFPGGLEPGEQQRLRLLPNTFGEWSNASLRGAKSATLTLSLVNVRDRYDTPLIPREVERLDEMRSEIDTLEAERRALAALL